MYVGSNPTEFTKLVDCYIFIEPRIVVVASVENKNWKGGRVRFNAAVLKTAGPSGSLGSNPSLSANRFAHRRDQSAPTR